MLGRYYYYTLPILIMCETASEAFTYVTGKLNALQFHKGPNKRYIGL